MSERAVGLRDIRFRHGSNSRDTLVISQLHIKAGQRVALIGASGAGKSTFLRLIDGRLRGWAGHCEVLGHPLDPGKLPPRSWRRKVGFVFQEFALVAARTPAAKCAARTSWPRIRDRRRSLGHFSLSLSLAMLIIWSWNGNDFEFHKLGASGTRIVDFLGRMIPPDLSVLPVLIESSIETLQIAVLGTVGCVLFSIVFGVLAAGNLTPPWINVPIKALLAVIRGIPLILVAMLMVGAVGLGALPGILAIAFHATGMLAKFYAKAIESVDPEPLEGLESAGAAILQKVRFGAWSQIAPDLLRDTLFRFEMNLRESLILGVVGAGGIGFYIQMFVRAFQYEKVATLAIFVVGFVVLIELGNSALLRLLR